VPSLSHQFAAVFVVVVAGGGPPGVVVAVVWGGGPPDVVVAVVIGVVAVVLVVAVVDVEVVLSAQDAKTTESIIKKLIVTQKILVFTECPSLFLFPYKPYNYLHLPSLYTTNG